MLNCQIIFMANLSPFDEDYKNIRDKGMCCDAIVNALQELLEGRK